MLAGKPSCKSIAFCIEFKSPVCDIAVLPCYYNRMNTSPDFFWDDNPVDITNEANFIWGILPTSSVDPIYTVFR